MAGEYSKENLLLLIDTVCKGFTPNEAAAFLKVCETQGLNPWTREVWAYKDNENQIQVFTGRDGFLAIAQRHPRYNGIRSAYVCEKDKISLDIPNGKVEHNHDPRISARGAIVGAYSIVFVQDGEPTIEWMDRAVYDQLADAWLTHTGEMCKKVAEAHALKKAFGITGINSEYSWSIQSGVAVPFDAEKEQEADILDEVRKLDDVK